MKDDSGALIYEKYERRLFIATSWSGAMMSTAARSEIGTPVFKYFDFVKTKSLTIENGVATLSQDLKIETENRKDEGDLEKIK